jgi:hypothetical protein
MTAPIATIRSQDELIEGLRAAKEMRNLSDRWLDECGDFTTGHINKILGPRREKGLSPFVLQMLLSMLAVKLVLVPDPDQEIRMRERWEGRDNSNVRPEPSRISQKLVERAKPLVLKENGSIGGKVRAHLLSPKQRSEIARKGGRARQRQRRKTMRERVAERKLLKQQEVPF